MSSMPSQEGEALSAAGQLDAIAQRLLVALNPVRVASLSFHDEDADVLWLITGAPENEFEPGETNDLKIYYPVDPTQLPKELAGVVWPPQT